MARLSTRFSTTPQSARAPLRSVEYRGFLGFSLRAWIRCMPECSEHVETIWGFKQYIFRAVERRRASYWCRTAEILERWMSRWVTTRRYSHRELQEKMERRWVARRKILNFIAISRPGWYVSWKNPEANHSPAPRRWPYRSASSGCGAASTSACHGPPSIICDAGKALAVEAALFTPFGRLLQDRYFTGPLKCFH